MINDARGSTWRKWDLHVHTPDSLVHGYSGTESWDRFIRELEQLPPEFKVLGINDYIFLDGYKRIIAEKMKGRLANIELFLPVIELRLDKFGGTHGHLSKVNFHIIFSNELSTDLIEQQFLNALSSQYILSPEYEHFRTDGKWAAIPTKQSLIDLGKLIINSVPSSERDKFDDPLIEGFRNLCLSVNTIHKALDSPYFERKFLTAVGKTEWANLKWSDRSIADKKTIINGVHLVFISAETVEGCVMAKRSLTDSGVNDRLLDCSDAHYFSDSPNKDRIGKCFTWLKADPTFEGLLQVLSEPNERVFLGEIPPKMLRVHNNKTKYIRSIRMERKPDATISETWFDNNISFNTDLIAIIGNRGKGKSALTDTIGLLCNTKQYKDFTFLSSDNFRHPKDNKAKYFQATLELESGSLISKGLDENIDERQPELAKYIPQNFLEKICTQLGNIEESDFDFEIKKVIFSHVDFAHRLGKASLDELISYKTSEANTKLQLLKQELHSINQDVVALEERIQPDFRQKVENLLELKRRELDSHVRSKPTEISKPQADQAKQKEMSDLMAIIEQSKTDLLEYEIQINKMSKERAKLVRHISLADKIILRLENLERQIGSFIRESKEDLRTLDLQLESIIKVSLNKEIVLDKRRSIHEQEEKLADMLAPAKEDSLVNKKLKIEEKINELQLKLDEPNKKYQAYQVAIKEWENKRNEIIGEEEKSDTIKYYESQISSLDAIPQKLRRVCDRRLEKAKEIHSVIKQLADMYRELYAPVNQFMERMPSAKEKIQLNFEVEITDIGFEQNFFEIISHGVSGTFCGVEEGHKMLRSMLAKHDFNKDTGAESFLTEIMDALENDKRPGGKPVRIVEQIRRGKNTITLYDQIYSLDYLKPRYSLRMGDKELHQLSPGERGTLLLVFYLLVDKDDIPLVIDQPEENLDNQTVYELLVPCVKEAKKQRQIFFVTHNPNLAVVCDAEQVIWADLDKKENYRMKYTSGALENPIINKAVVDILEGTMPAFDKRDSKYFSPNK